MNYFPQIFTLAGVWLLAVITPGPDFAVTVRYAAARSRRDGIWVALGITSALAIWSIGSSIGMGFLLAQASWLVSLIRTAGALYLVYLGIQTFRNAHQPVPSATLTHTHSSWRIGFFTNLGNPKAVAFFSSLFVTLLPVHSPVWVDAVSILLMLTIAASWFTLVACIFALDSITRAYRRLKRWLDYLTGSIFVALGLRLALER